jgi:hypothetical protein
VTRAAALVLLCVAMAGCASQVAFSARSPDRRRRVVVVQDGGEQRVQLDGRDSPPYLGVGVDALSWSRDGNHLAYPARRHDGWVVVRDGVAGPPWEGVGSIAWSPRGDHLAYAAEKRGRWFVVRDGQPGAPHDGLRARSLRFSADGEHLGYAAEAGGRVVVVLDGNTSSPYDAAGRLVLGPGGRHGFVAQRGQDMLVVVAGAESGRYEDVADLALSPGDGRAAWIARSEGAWRVVLDGRESEPFARISALLWSRAGLLSYVASRGEGALVVVDGAAGPTHDEVLAGSLTFDAAGTLAAYAASKGGAWRAIVGGKEGPRVDEIGPPCFLGTSPALAYLARRGNRRFLVVDGHQGPAHEEASELVTSADGSRFAFLARDGGNTSVIEGRVLGAGCGGGACRPREHAAMPADVFVDGSLTFSRDGEHLGWLAGDRADRQLFLMVDGARLRPFDLVELLEPPAAEALDSAMAAPGTERFAELVRAELALLALRKPGPP